MKLTDLPDTITSVDQLEDILTAPSELLVDFMKTLEGDIMILGAGGKVGPSVCMRAKRAIDAAGVDKKVYAVDIADLPALAAKGIETLKCDMLDINAVDALPKVKNVIYMVGRKFGSTGSEHLTWAINVIVPYHVARAFTESNIVVFSTGCVYPVVNLFTGGATEDLAPDPVGEYAQSCLGRERMFEYYSRSAGEKVLQLRLNYAVELRYGVLADIAQKIFAGEEIDLTTGFANVMWQGDVCDQVIRALALADSPPVPLNITGPETFSIKRVAIEMGRIMGKDPIFTGTENGCGYLNNATLANSLLGNPQVPLGVLIKWVASWVSAGGENSGKPTHFETQNGKY